jgi:hypothetical protein
MLQDSESLFFFSEKCLLAIADITFSLTYTYYTAIAIKNLFKGDGIF